MLFLMVILKKKMLQDIAKLATRYRVEVGHLDVRERRRRRRRKRRRRPKGTRK
jgi:hypothetical protein